jgi:transposase
MRRTWAPRGQTPFVRHKFNWERAHAIGALACQPDGQQGQLLLYLQEQAINKETIVSYLHALHQHLPGPLVLLWDRLPAHRSQVVKEYLAANQDWLSMEFLPAYAPELNPVEYVWSAFKGKDVANSSPQETVELAARLHQAQERVAANQETLFGFLLASTLFKRERDCSST